MASLREIRNKIKSVRAVRKITQTMKMVATARLKRAQTKMLNSRPFAQKMNELVNDLASRIELEKVNPDLRQYFQPPASGREVFLLITSDRGLCGSFNTLLFRQLTKETNQSSPPFIIVFGKKGWDYLRQINYPIYSEYIGIWAKMSFAQAEIIGEELLELYEKENLSAVKIAYNHFISPLRQQPTIKTILPLIPPKPLKHPLEYLYEPNQEAVLTSLIPRYFESEIYLALLESRAAELAARMTAMDNATKNADELTDYLILTMNKIRQAGITREISELVVSAEALQ